MIFKPENRLTNFVFSIPGETGKSTYNKFCRLYPGIVGFTSRLIEMTNICRTMSAICNMKKVPDCIFIDDKEKAR